MDNLNKVITISAIESKMFDSGTQYKIKANGLTFKFYDKKKDGNETVAFRQFKDMGLKVGSTVDVWYKEMAKEYEGKPYTDRLIASFREAAGVPVASTSPKTAPQREFNGNDLFGRRLALHGFVNARLVNNPISQVEQELDMLLKLENKIDSVLNPNEPPIDEAPPEINDLSDTRDLPF